MHDSAISNQQETLSLYDKRRRRRRSFNLVFNVEAFISSNLVFNGNGYLVDGKIIRFHYHMPFLSILFFLVESLLFDQLQLRDIS